MTEPAPAESTGRLGASAELAFAGCHGTRASGAAAGSDCWWQLGSAATVGRRWAQGASLLVLIGLSTRAAQAAARTIMMSRADTRRTPSARGLWNV